MGLLKKIYHSKKAEQQLLSQLRVIQLCQQHQALSIESTTAGVGNDEAHDIVISLTTFNKRINDVHLTIESLLQQSLKADRILLWISREDFTPEDVPKVLRLQEQRGLEVRFCQKDYGPYTKFYYTLQSFPDSLILTVDDDLIYPSDLVDLLYRAYLREPDYVHCHRAHKMTFTPSGQLKPYKEWEKPTNDYSPSLHIFPTGVGGVLYYPGCFADEILDQEIFLRLAPNSDDVWLKAMTLKKGTLCKRIEDHRDWGRRFPVVEGSQKFSLKRKNKSIVSGNDPKIQAVFDYYKLFDQLT
jgi:hypothetical protein